MDKGIIIMATYSQILSIKYPGNSWRITGDDYDTLIWNEKNKDDKPTKKELDSFIEEVDVELAWEAIRLERNRLLQETDWTQLADTPKAIQKKWKSYREELRAIPQFFDDPDFVVFPDKPE
jgi:hypothetical protein